MKTGEVRSVEKLKAVQRGRKISNLTISVILSCVVTAAAQSDPINKEDPILGPAPVVTPPKLLNTSRAGVIVSAMQILPVTLIDGA